MNKLWVLLRAQLLGLTGLNRLRRSADPKERARAVRFLILMMFVGVALTGSLAVYNILYIRSFLSAGHPELMPALMMAIASVVTLFTTVYKTNGLLVGFRDYDITMSLPVPKTVVAASRLLLLYLMNLAFSLLINLCAGIVYAVYVPVGAWFFLRLGILSLLTPLLPLLAGALLGILAAAVSSRFRRAGMLNTLITMLLVLALMGASFAIPSTMENPSGFGQSLMGSLNRLYPLTGMYGKALCYGSAPDFLLFSGLSLLVFGAFSILLGKAFGWLNTAFTTTRTRSHYRLTALRASAMLPALYRRELRRYLTSAVYVTNTAIGMVLALIMCGALLFVSPDQLGEAAKIPGLAQMLGTLMPMALAMMVSMSCTTSSSVSMEGRNLWIIQSLPVPAKAVFDAKLLVNLTVTLPAALVCGVLLVLAVPLSAVGAAMAFLTPWAFAGLSALGGLYLNLYFPKFDWPNETVVVKQSVPTMLTALGGMACTAGLTAGLLLLPAAGREIGLAGLTAAVFALDALLYGALGTKGVRLWRAL